MKNCLKILLIVTTISTLSLTLINCSKSTSKACLLVQDCCNYINNSPGHKKVAGERCEYAKFGIEENNEKACLTSIARIRGEIGHAASEGAKISIPPACGL